MDPMDQDKTLEIYKSPGFVIDPMVQDIKL